MPLLGNLRPRSVALATALALGVGVSCMLLDGASGGGGLTFSHRVHVVEEQLECINCHENAFVVEAPGMPVADMCQICHADLDAAKPDVGRVQSLFVDNVLADPRSLSLHPEVLFSHLRHVEDVDDCASCHQGIERSEAPVRDLPVVGMDACIRCHESRDLPVGCGSCHTEVGPDRAPDNHGQSWMKTHGWTARLPYHGDQNARCDLCHRESSCVQCHLTDPPDNHNQFWRLRGHAVASMIDRNGCAMCHQPTECRSCHADTLPTSHTGIWAAPRSTHCISCHEPLTRTTCATCHQGTPSHLSAPVKPSWHTPTLDCRSCHGATLRLSHVDNGDNCNSCHL